MYDLLCEMHCKRHRKRRQQLVMFEDVWRYYRSYLLHHLPGLTKIDAEVPDLERHDFHLSASCPDWHNLAKHDILSTSWFSCFHSGLVSFFSPVFHPMQLRFDAVGRHFTLEYN